MDEALSSCEQARQYYQSEDYELSLSLYTKGIQLLMQILEATKDAKRRDKIRELIADRLDNAENVKSCIAQKKARDQHSTNVTQLKIADGSTGYDYHVIFDRCLDDSVTSVEIDDPYIRNPYQVRNLVRVCELLLRKTKVKYIKLITGQEPEKEKRNKQHGQLEELRISLQMRDVTFTHSLSDTLHNREIRFNNGWKLIIDRGLDYFKPFKGQFAIGYFDFNLRACKETSVTYMKDTG